MAQLRCDGIVPVHDVGVERGMGYLVTDLMYGGTLRQSLKNGPWSVGRSVVTLAKVAGGLAVCHAHGFVHRDIRPDNLFLSVDGDKADLKPSAA